MHLQIHPGIAVSWASLHLVLDLGLSLILHLYCRKHWLHSQVTPPLSAPAVSPHFEHRSSDVDVSKAICISSYTLPS